MAEQTDALDLIWGVEEIGKYIGRSYAQTQHMLSTGKLPGRRIGERWVASKARLAAFFIEDAA